MNRPGKKKIYQASNSDLLKNKRVVKITMILLVFIFGLQLLSHFLLQARGREKKAGEPPNTEMLKWSSRFSPFEAPPLLAYGYALLRESTQSGDQEALTGSIDILKKAISGNMLYYNGHLYLGKAYIAGSLADPTLFEPAVESFKRAARIRGNDVRVSMDTMTILLSLWPHLSDEDREFCSNLLSKSINMLTPAEFNALLENWALFSRDTGFFKESLTKRPRFYELAAGKLAQLEMNINMRREFLLKHSLYVIADAKNRYQAYRSAAPDVLLKKLKDTAADLDKRVSLYYFKVVPDAESKLSNYFNFKKRLYLEILGLLFSRSGWQQDEGLKKEIEKYILTYVADFSSMSESRLLFAFLKEKGYFKPGTSDIRVFYIKQLISLKSGQFSKLINEIEGFKSTVSFIKKDYAKDYAVLLLMFTDAYISSRLMASAQKVLNDIPQGDVNPGDYYLRKMLIERVVGPEAGEDEVEKQRQYEFINDSRRIEMNKPVIEKTVYLLNKRDVKIGFTDGLYEKIKNAHLLQVYVDGELIFEEYLGQLALPVNVAIPAKKLYSKHKLIIKIK